MKVELTRRVGFTFLVVGEVGGAAAGLLGVVTKGAQMGFGARGGLGFPGVEAMGIL